MDASRIHQHANVAFISIPLEDISITNTLSGIRCYKVFNLKELFTKYSLLLHRSMPSFHIDHSVVQKTLILRDGQSASIQSSPSQSQRKHSSFVISLNLLLPLIYWVCQNSCTRIRFRYLKSTFELFISDNLHFLYSKLYYPFILANRDRLGIHTNLEAQNPIIICYIFSSDCSTSLYVNT